MDGGLVWAVDPDSELVSLTDLAALPAGSTIVAPGFAMTSASGVPALEAAYDAKLAAEPLDDPAQRVAALADGHVAAAFRRTESIDLDGLDVLTDPVGILTPDPLVAALSAQFAEQRPDAVLVLDAVQHALTDDSWPNWPRAPRWTVSTRRWPPGWPNTSWPADPWPTFSGPPAGFADDQRRLQDHLPRRAVVARDPLGE